MTKIFKYKKHLIVAAIIISFIIGIMLFKKLCINNYNYIIDNKDKITYISFKTLLFHILIINLSFVFSFFGVGIIFFFIYFLYETLVYGFIFEYYYSIYHLNGLLYGIIFFIIFKFVFFFLIFILLIKFFKIFKSIITIIKNKTIDITTTIFNILIIEIILIFNDIFLIIFGKIILNLFTFLLK